jgi:hypothetical protein
MVERWEGLSESAILKKGRKRGGAVRAGRNVTVTVLGHALVFVLKKNQHGHMRASTGL